MATISEKKAIIELYVGWFNRVPDVAGINFWIEQFDAGSSLQQISGEFYQAAIHQFSAETGYAEGMTDDAFIAQLYDGVMGRGPTTALAPNADEIAYWTNALAAFNGDKGALLVQMIVEIKAFDSTGNADIKAVQDKFANKVQVAETLSISGIPLWTGNTIAEGKAALATVTEDDATVDAAIDAALNATNTNTTIASTGADIVDGTSFDDTFLATQDTLGLGDEFNGKEGSDTLDISISGTGVTLAGFKTTAVEHIHVKSLSTSASILDLSDVSGASMIRSSETDGAPLTFRDIQETSASIDIVDTDEHHNINYDAQTLSGTDTITLNVQEIRPETGAATVDIDFTQDTTASDAAIENLVLNSGTISNNIKSISVGDALGTLDINGDANLSVMEALDQNLNTVNAIDLAATLTLDMSNANQSDADADGTVDLGIAFTGATGDTSITFGTAANTKTITTQGGNDTIITGNGTNTVDSAAGNDTITSGTGNDTITAGEGDDTVTDASLTGNNTVTLGAGNDTVTFIKDSESNDTITGGDGNDTITAAAGQDSIDGGAGDDLIIEDVGDLEVSDTITGGEGTDTVQILDGDNITASEAQRVTEVEIFDLEGAGTTLTVTDNLVKTATDNKFTVDTETATGSHTIDMTSITTPDYKFELKGSNTTSDTVIANDATINSLSTLSFGINATTTTTTVGGVTTTTVATLPTADTLRIVDGATITPSDLINVTGLDAMYLESSSNIRQTWNIDLELSSPITITVSPEVPDGSVLNISSSVAGVKVQHNANITVNITGTTPGNVTTDSLLNNSANLTANADDLVGSVGNDTFIASDIDFLSAADSVDGDAGSDTLILGDGGIFNAALSLHEQFNKAGISNIETITFKTDTATGVSFNDIDGTTGSIEAALNEINLTNQNDTVIVGDTGITINALKGNDTVTLIGAESAIVHGGEGADTITGSTADDTLNGDAGDDTIVGNGGNDTVNGGLGNDTITTSTGNDTIDAGDGDDVVDASSGNDSVTLGAGTDSVTIAADDLSTADTITGGDGSDTLKTSDAALTDADFTNVTTMEVLELTAATTGDFASEFKESGIRTVNGSAGVDDISFEGVSNDANLTIDGKDGDDIIMGGSGNDTITAGEGADTITGSTGGDTIDLGDTDDATDLVVYTRAEDGAQTGQTVDSNGHLAYDVIQLFDKVNDRIVIDGDLERALDLNTVAGADDVVVNGVVTGAGVDGIFGDFTIEAGTTFTNNAAVDANAAGLVTYTNTSLIDADLIQTSNSGNFSNVLNLLNTNLQTSGAGDNVLYVVQSTNNTGLYFYQENTGDNVIDLTELKMLALIDSGITSSSASSKSASVIEESKGDSLLTAADISDEAVSLAGVAANLGAVTLTADAATVNEGENAGFTLAATGVDDGTVLNYTVTGVDAADITDANADGDNNALTGTTTVTNDAATISLAIATDAIAAENETLTVSIDTTAATASTTIVDVVAPTAVAVNATGIDDAGADSTQDAAAADTTFTFAAGNYAYSIANFASNDVLDFFEGAIINVVADTDQNDGIQVLTAVDTESTVTLTLTGLSAEQDSALFNTPAFDTVFGAGTLI